MLTQQQVMASLREVKPVLTRYGVSELALFGSYARNEQQQNSDIDILIDFFDEDYKYDNLYKVYEYLSDKFDGYKIEVVTKRSLVKGFKENILNETEYV